MSTHGKKQAVVVVPPIARKTEHPGVVIHDVAPDKLPPEGERRTGEKPDLVLEGVQHDRRKPKGALGLLMRNYDLLGRKV